MAKNRWIAVLTVLLLLLAVPKAMAAEQGSIKVCGIEHTVSVFSIASADGTLKDDFADAPVDITDEKQAVSNAKTLWKYAKEHQISGWDQQADAGGNAMFAPLEEGLYLLVSTAEEEEFDPFLVKIPTVIDGKRVYHIEAEPKQEEDPPTEPTTPPTEPPKPNIPQTGTSVIPKYLLMGCGILVTLTGLFMMIRGKESYE